MPGKDPARGARDTGRTDRGLGDRGGRGGRGPGSGKRAGDTAIGAFKSQFADVGSGFGTGAGTQGPAAAGQKPNRDMSGDRAARKQKDALDRARGYKPGTLAPDEVPTYDRLPTLGQLTSAISMSPTSGLGAISAMGSIADAAINGDPFGRDTFGRSLDQATGAEPGNYSGGTNISRDSGRYGGTGTSGGNKKDSDAAAEERRKRRLAAQQTALGQNPNSLLGPGVEPI